MSAGAVRTALGRALARRMSEDCGCSRRERLATLSGLVGRPVASTLDLAESEARALLAAYTATAHGEESVGRLTTEGEAWSA